MAVSKRTTIYLDEDIHRTLRQRAFETSSSVSEIVNEAVKALLAEDAEDIEDFEARKNEPRISYEDMILRLKQNGRI